MSNNDNDLPDLCDCGAFNQFRSIQRLLNTIRQNQFACNERECLINDLNQTGTEYSDSLQLMLIFLAWSLLVSLIYLFWPRNNESTRKPVNNYDNNDNNDNSEASLN